VKNLDLLFFQSLFFQSRIHPIAVIFVTPKETIASIIMQGSPS